jgi:hypothetical protein
MGMVLASLIVMLFSTTIYECKKAKGEGSHVPFRHSMMTMVLRDSLGGNCNTKMIATVSLQNSFKNFYIIKQFNFFFNSSFKKQFVSFLAV